MPPGYGPAGNTGFVPMGPGPQLSFRARVWRFLVYTINPAQAAKRTLRAQNRLAPPDARIEQVRLIRTLLGMAVVGWVALKYDSVDWNRVFSEAILHVTISVVVACVAVPLVALILVLMTDPAKRRETRRSMRYPMASMGAFLGAGGTLTVLALLKITEISSSGALMILVVLGWFALIWCGLFAIVAFFQVPRHLFAAADGHLLMPCLLAPTLSWAVAVVDLASPGNNRVPAVVAVIVTVGAPATITAMSVWEAKRVKELYGVSFRGGSQPTRIPAPSAPGTVAAVATAMGVPAAVTGHNNSGGAWLPNQSGGSSWVPSFGGNQGGVRPFPHGPHILGVVLTCGFWAIGYFTSYVRWKARQNAAIGGGWR